MGGDGVGVKIEYEYENEYAYDILKRNKPTGLRRSAWSSW